MQHKHITRLDYEKTHGWWVRILRKSNPCSKLFSDGVYGGREAALIEAINWRDEMLAVSPRLLHREKESSLKAIPTGVTGLSVSFTRGATGKLANFQVSISRNGKRVSTRYSIAKWGLRAALWKSCVALAKGSVSGKAIQTQALAYFEASYDKVIAALEEAELAFEK